jgi:hypothetical protein
MLRNSAKFLCSFNQLCGRQLVLAEVEKHEPFVVYGNRSEVSGISIRDV